MYYINDGIYGSFNSLLYDHAVVTPIPLSVSLLHEDVEIFCQREFTQIFFSRKSTPAKYYHVRSGVRHAMVSI